MTTAPEGIAWIDGRVTPIAEAAVPVTDRGFLYGESVYEVFRTFQGRPVQLESHLARLDRSAAAIGLDGVDRDRLRAALREAYAASGLVDVALRLIVTRGDGYGLGHPGSAQPRFVLIVTPLEFPPERWYRDGIRLDWAREHRDGPGAPPPGYKTGNYRQHAAALAAAKASGFDDALFLNGQGLVTEGTTSNVFWWADDMLHTPSIDCGLLAGTTRAMLLDACREAGVAVREGRYRPEALLGADEAWLTGSVKGVVPIVAVGEDEIGAGVPGPMDARLRRLHDDALARRTSDW